MEIYSLKFMNGKLKPRESVFISRSENTVNSAHSGRKEIVKTIKSTFTYNRETL